MKLLLAFLFTFSLFPSTSMESEHKFYVSTTIIEENVLSNTLEITVKIFTDDLEDVLEKSSGEILFLGSEKEHEEADRFIQDYLSQHLRMSFNDRASNPVYLGKEIEFDLSYLYFEISPRPEFSVLILENDLLVDLYPEQVNIVHLRFSGWEQRLMLDAKNPSITVSR